MINLFFSNSFLVELTAYLYSHIFLCLFFAMHFFLIRFIKNKIDIKNRILKNYTTVEKRRFILNSIKSVFNLDKQIEDRYSLYLRYYIK